MFRVITVREQNLKPKHPGMFNRIIDRRRKQNLVRAHLKMVPYDGFDFGQDSGYPRAQRKFCP
jgi:hypothetical protein